MLTIGSCKMLLERQNLSLVCACVAGLNPANPANQNCQNSYLVRIDVTQLFCYSAILSLKHRVVAKRNLIIIYLL
jgi:hypothetical protein